MESILDAEMLEQVIWPAQADCGGRAWNRTFSLAEGRRFDPAPDQSHQRKRWAAHLLHRRLLTDLLAGALIAWSSSGAGRGTSRACEVSRCANAGSGCAPAGCSRSRLA